MRDVSRRNFLQLMGAAGGAMMLNGAFTRLAFGATTADKLLVVIFLRGGMDALNAVVPAFEHEYFDARPTIGVPAASLLPLDGYFGLHPSLAPLLPIYKASNLAFVHACGNPDPSRSHFAAQRSMEQANYQAGAPAGGWIDRYLASRSSPNRTECAGLGVSHTMPISLQGPLAALSMVDLDTFKLNTYPSEAARFQAALWSLYDGATAPFGAGKVTLSALTKAAAAAALPQSSVTYPSSALGKALRDVARLRRGNVGLEGAAVDVDDWDMHVDIGSPTGGALATKLADLGSSLAAFVSDLGSDFSNTTIVVMSEFGRRVAQNGNGGADHGHGTCLFLLGGGINGGRVYGEWPGLAAGDLDNGDLAITTDYRDVLSEVVSKRLGNSNLGAVFPGYTPRPVGIF